jgi:hypothetical protein
VFKKRKECRDDRKLARENSERKKKKERKKKERWQHSSVSNYNKQERSNFKTFANRQRASELET